MRIRKPRKPRPIRFTLSVTAEVNAVLTGISKATNTPKSHIIAELLNESLPVFKTVLTAVEDAKQGRIEASVNAMSVLVDKVTSDVRQVNTEMDDFELKHANKL
jgi:hypothetical protein